MTELELLEQICDRLTGIQLSIAVLLILTSVLTSVIITYLMWRK